MKWILVLLSLAMFCGCTIIQNKEETKKKSKSYQINLVDTKATPETKSLFVYLKNNEGKGTIFGHENTFFQGLTIDPNKPAQSDVKNSIGDFPGLFGFDFLTMWENSTPLPFADYVKEAYEMGGIVSISFHMPNFTTGEKYTDTSICVPYIIPGGKDFEKYKKALNRVADFANNLKDKNGNLIPVIFRPFHENHGSWFWWGAAECSKAEYIALWRFTVDYLKSKNVHNFLYAYSPSGFFNGSKDEYLKRYPGDDYVDILGFDIYDSQPATDMWLKNMIEDIDMLVPLANSKGKIAVIAETGVSKGIKIKNNPNKNWYSEKMLKVLEHDKNTRKIAYFLVWRNGHYGHFWVPFKNDKKYGDSEMLPDFEKFYKSKTSLFLKDLKNVYDIKNITVIPHKTNINFFSPLDRDYVTQNQNIIISTDLPDSQVSSIKVYYGNTETTLKQSGNFYIGNMDINSLSKNKFNEVKAVLITKNGNKISDTINVRLKSNKKIAPNIVDDYSEYFDSTDLNNTYSRNSGGNKVELSLNNIDGKKSMVYDYILGQPSYAGVTKAVPGNNWSKYSGILIPVNNIGTPVSLTVQIKANSVAWEGNIELKTGEKTTAFLPFDKFHLPSWYQGKEQTINVSKITGFSLYVGLPEGQKEAKGKLILGTISLK